MMVRFILFLSSLFILLSSAYADDFKDISKVERAISQDNDYAARSIINEGVDPNILLSDGTPALYKALSNGAFKVARVLVSSRKIDVNLENESGETPLMMAAIKGQIDLVNSLMSRGARVNKSGWSPLHYAVSSSADLADEQLKITRVFLTAGADVNAKSPNGTTPLMMAAAYGSADTVKLLIEYAADVNQTNMQGLNAFDFAEKYSRQDAQKILKQSTLFSKDKATGVRQLPRASVDIIDESNNAPISATQITNSEIEEKGKW